MKETKQGAANRIATAAVEGTRGTVTVTAGKRPGFVDLLFASKPDVTTRSMLKAQGFRWSPTFGVWYGLASRLSPDWLASVGAKDAAQHAAQGEGDNVRDPGEDAADRWSEAQRGAF